METSTLREKLHSLIDNSPEEKLIEVYSIFREEEYTNEFKANLNEEYADYQQNGEVISREEMNEVIDKLLYGK